MRNILIILLFLTTWCFSCTSFALISMELTRGVAGAIPVAVVPFHINGEAVPQPVSTIINNDLQNSGRFKVFGERALSQFPSEVSQVSSRYFRKLGTDNVVIGRVTALGGDRYQVNFALLGVYEDSAGATVKLSKRYVVSGRELRAVSHHISDMIYEKITGVRGMFSTRLVYVVVQRAAGAPTRYVLEVADQDGYGPRPLLNSPEPIMSPSWSRDGRNIAYVSFENHHAGIYLQNVVTGSRHLLSEFPGINGAPAWSPDGSKLAIVLSKAGTPNIYVMNIRSGALKQLTNDFYINTEPAWSPNGQRLLFTSNRSGGPQLYQMSATGGPATRLSYDGDYNARGSYTPDGRQIAMIHRVSGIYKIAMLDLDAGTTRVLTTAGDSASPSVAPNGTMVLYDTISGGRNVLGMVSADGRIQLLLPARQGEAQDPAWSPV
ncbi:MAG TPA: Tol-Pal system beta propeller repeat protein TolB [Gammaproteobacteria bacterium]|jgi:TolB protein|nr:Tol-Pal system beta propeller repeat protein TolB [Gammaproteobacteria bacterium]